MHEQIPLVDMKKQHENLPAYILQRPLTTNKSFFLFYSTNFMNLWLLQIRARIWKERWGVFFIILGHFLCCCRCSLVGFLTALNILRDTPLKGLLIIYGFLSPAPLRIEIESPSVIYGRLQVWEAQRRSGQLKCLFMFVVLFCQVLKQNTYYFQLHRSSRRICSCGAS